MCVGAVVSPETWGCPSAVSGAHGGKEGALDARAARVCPEGVLLGRNTSLTASRPIWLRLSDVPKVAESLLERGLCRQGCVW